MMVTKTIQNYNLYISKLFFLLVLWSNGQISTSQSVLKLANDSAPDVEVASFNKDDLIHIYPLNTTRPDWSIKAKLLSYHNDSVRMEIHKDILLESPSTEFYQNADRKFFRRNQPEAIVYELEERPVLQMAIKDVYYIQKARKSKLLDNKVFVVGLSMIAGGLTLYWNGEVGEARNNGLENLKIPGLLGMGLGAGVVALSLPISLGGRRFNLKPEVETSTLFLPMN